MNSKSKYSKGLVPYKVVCLHRAVWLTTVTKRPEHIRALTLDPDSYGGHRIPADMGDFFGTEQQIWLPFKPCPKNRYIPM